MCIRDRLCFVLLVEVGFAPAAARLSRVFDVEVPPRATDSCPLRASFLTALAIFYGLQDGQGEGGTNADAFSGSFLIISRNREMRSRAWVALRYALNGVATIHMPALGSPLGSLTFFWSSRVHGGDLGRVCRAGPERHPRNVFPTQLLLDFSTCYLSLIHI